MVVLYWIGQKVHLDFSVTWKKPNELFDQPSIFFWCYFGKQPDKVIK